MCRHVAYLGPPRTLHELIYAPPHSLHTQSYAPREQTHGTVNADGFGVGWFDPDTGNGEHTAPAAPLRYRRAMPIWADTSFADTARAVRSGCVVAAVRDGTVGFPVDESCAQPFRGDNLLFSHNGAVSADEAVTRELAAPLPSEVVDARAPVDSAPLFAMAIRLWRDGQPLGRVLSEVVGAARALSPGRYNLLASEGATLAATACGDTLYVRDTEEAVMLASEPWDSDPAWQRVPDGSLITASPGAVTVTALDH
ncbi:ergothioneine biosynthesis protein EgtC [Salinactinospora qingdaonensis]|uniref:Gamma-glutamyl-hercynylcysteine sulfoxide hydrolase n=1 Tax=Salinactinospora qingdaonensis TaxID=702744 RepID=A0ABP7EWZ2_9ACTN